jgi:clan AA aspartic protease
MGMVNAEVILRNMDDDALFRHGKIEEKDIRQVMVTSLVDTGAANLVINEATRAKLGVKIVHTGFATLADGSQQECHETEPVQICWKDRDCFLRATVLPTANEVLLGALPLEAMDLIIHPKTQSITGAHGDDINHIIYRHRWRRR